MRISPQEYGKKVNSYKTSSFQTMELKIVEPKIQLCGLDLSVSIWRRVKVLLGTSEF
jgi:hypothetical protein